MRVFRVVAAVAAAAQVSPSPERWAAPYQRYARSRVVRGLLLLF